MFLFLFRSESRQRQCPYSSSVPSLASVKLKRLFLFLFHSVAKAGYGLLVPTGS
jgi:hypothetical protein